MRPALSLVLLSLQVETLAGSVTVNYNAKQQADMNSVTQETVDEFADTRLGLQRFVTGHLCKDCCAGGRSQPGTCVVTKRALPTKSWRTGVTAT
jgi:hypothetical protein